MQSRISERAKTTSGSRSSNSKRRPNLDRSFESSYMSNTKSYEQRLKTTVKKWRIANKAFGNSSGPGDYETNTCFGVKLSPSKERTSPSYSFK